MNKRHECIERIEKKMGMQLGAKGFKAGIGELFFEFDGVLLLFDGEAAQIQGADE